MNKTPSKSGFWDYFHDYLVFPWIFKPNALSVIIKGLALVLDDVKLDIIGMRNQFIVPKADAKLIAEYGLSRGVPRTRFDNDKQYRTRTERAFIWHKLGGRERGLPKILEEYGYAGGEIENMRATDVNLWAHFNINLLEPGTSLEQEKIDAIYDIANEYKPARSVINNIGFALRQYSPVCVGASQRIAVVFSHVITIGKLDFKDTPLHIGAKQTLFVSIHNTVIPKE